MPVLILYPFCLKKSIPLSWLCRWPYVSFVTGLEFPSSSRLGKHGKNPSITLKSFWYLVEEIVTIQIQEPNCIFPPHKPLLVCIFSPWDVYGSNWTAGADFLSFYSVHSRGWPGVLFRFQKCKLVHGLVCCCCCLLRDVGYQLPSGSWQQFHSALCLFSVFSWEKLLLFLRARFQIASLLPLHRFEALFSIVLLLINPDSSL